MPIDEESEKEQGQTTPREVRKYLGVILQYVLTTAVGIVAWQGQQVLNRMDKMQTQIYEQDKRLEIIESNRYTPTEALRDQTSTQKEMNTKFELLRTAIEKASVPPDYLLEDIREIKEELKKVNDSIVKIKDSHNGDQ